MCKHSGLITRKPLIQGKYQLAFKHNVKTKYKRGTEKNLGSRQKIYSSLVLKIIAETLFRLYYVYIEIMINLFYLCSTICSTLTNLSVNTRIADPF